MNNTKPLTDEEMYKLIYAAYPEDFRESYDSKAEIEEFINGLTDYEPYKLADLLGRVVMMTIPVPLQTPVIEDTAHCLGVVKIIDGKLGMRPIVKREANE